MRKAMERWRLGSLLCGFIQWREFALDAYDIQAGLGILGKALMRLRHRQMWMAFRKWRDAGVALSRQQKIMLKALQRLRQKREVASNLNPNSHPRNYDL